MFHSSFIINRRFRVDSNLNLLTDLNTGDAIRLEPRMTALITLLAESSGQLVSREVFISRIWNDYGGAEDGLNQGVSFLRKVLKDSNKELIKTIPKKGYVLNAEITEGEVGEANPPTGLRPFWRHAVGIAVIVLFIAGCIIWNGPSKSNNHNLQAAQKSKMVQAKNVEADFSDLTAPAGETYLTAITTVAPDSTRYRLVAIGDKRPDFYINDRLVPELQREAYAALIDNMLRKLWERKKDYEDSLHLVTSEP